MSSIKGRLASVERAAAGVSGGWRSGVRVWRRGRAELAAWLDSQGTEEQAAAWLHYTFRRLSGQERESLAVALASAESGALEPAMFGPFTAADLQALRELAAGPELSAWLSEWLAGMLGRVRPAEVSA